VTTLRLPSKSKLALRFFVLSVGLLLVAMLIAVSGIRLSDSAGNRSRSVMPIAFWISTALLTVGSATLHQAAWYVRRQRLEPFRRQLVSSLLAGTLFVGVQCAGLWRLVQNQDPQAAETGANAFVVMVAGMHGVHILVALLFIAWVTVNAYGNRYDHEYSSSVTFCAWFWHALGIVWLVILSLFAAGAITGFEGISVPDPQTRGLGATAHPDPAKKTSHETGDDREDRRGRRADDHAGLQAAAAGEDPYGLRPVRNFLWPPPWSAKLCATERTFGNVNRRSRSLPAS
jgi:cytochrome c oxidase subunit III